MRETTRVKVAARAAERGGTLLGDAPGQGPEVRARSRRLRFRCAKGHLFDATSDSLLNQRSWCPHCAGNARGSLETFVSWATSHGGVCLATRYVNNRTRMPFRCARGHDFLVSAREIRAGRGWCGVCREHERHRVRLDEVREALARRGWVLLSDTWPGTRTPLRVRDAAGRERLMRADQIVTGRRSVAVRTRLTRARRDGPST